jgi:hypothetical protein
MLILPYGEGPEDLSFPWPPNQIRRLSAYSGSEGASVLSEWRD